MRLEDIIGLPADDAVMCSGKTGIGIEDLLEAIVQKVPAPAYDEVAPLRSFNFRLAKVDDYSELSHMLKY